MQLVPASAALAIAVQRSVQLVAFGLRAADKLTSHDPNVPNAVVQIGIEKAHRRSLRAIRAEHKRWIIANGLRDCVESLGVVLEAARLEATLWDLGGTITARDDGRLSVATSVVPEDWNRRIVAMRGRFDRMPLPNKIDHLERHLQVCRPSLTEAILSISAARNCLAHRGGIVGPEDVTPDNNSLVVKWRRFLIEGKTPGRRRRVVRLGERLEAETLVSIRQVGAARRFRLGRRISLSARDYVEIATTFVFFGQELQERIREMQLARFAAQEGKTS